MNSPLQDTLESMGFTLEGRRKHLRWRHRNGGLLITSVTPSDHRAARNIIRDAKRVAAGANHGRIP
jgi:hypothetical protein